MPKGKKRSKNAEIMEKKSTRISDNSHTVLPLVSTTLFNQLLDAFRKGNIDYEQEFHAFSIPKEITCKNGKLPAYQFLSFVQSVLHKSNSHTFGFEQSVHSAPAQLLRLGVAQRTRTLQSLIQSTAKCLNSHSDIFRLKKWTESDSSLWLGMQQHPSLNTCLIVPYLGVQLTMLIEIIRYVESRDWLPSQIILPMEKRDLFYAPFWLQNCRVRYVKNLIGIKISASSLDKKPSSLLKIGSSEDKKFFEEDPLTHSSMNGAVYSVESVLRTYLQSTQSAPSYHMMAEINGISDRSLSRKLNREGENYRSLVHKVRIDLSRKYLRESDAKVETIANSLGYPRCSSFVRSFQLLTGESPTEYRRASNQG